MRTNHLSPITGSSSYILIFTLLGLLHLHAQIPNPGFENWTDCAPTDWASSSICGVVTPVTRSSNPASGAWAARGEVVTLFTQTVAPVLQSGPTGEGFPISQRYETVEGMYMFSPIGGDRFGVNIAFLRGQTVVAQGALAISTPAATYTRFVTPMTYFSSDVPDTAIFQFQIVGPVTGSDYHVGSVMHLDSLSFGTGGGTNAPALSIVRNGTSVIVSWDAAVTGYTLQSTSDLDTPNWTPVSGVGPGNSYEFTPTSQQYFRLFKP